MVTSIEELKKAKQTWEFKAPPFANGIELVVELRQPALTTMMLDGTISNPLLNDVQTLVEPEKKNSKKATAAQKVSAFKFINTVVNYCVVSPTIQEIEEYAGGLTDNQILAIYEEEMKTVTDMSSFRTDSANS
jgi:hypothetical protein